jgi:UBA/TS-N domain
MSTPSAPPAPVPLSSAPVPAAPATPSPSAAAAPLTRATESSAFNDPSALVLGRQSAAAVAEMEAMGFEKSDIDRAMRAAFYNPDRAIDYLLNVSILSFAIRLARKTNLIRASRKILSKSRPRLPPPPLVPPKHLPLPRGQTRLPQAERSL